MRCLNSVLCEELRSQDLDPDPQDLTLKCVCVNGHLRQLGRSAKDYFIQFCFIKRVYFVVLRYNCCQSGSKAKFHSRQSLGANHDSNYDPILRKVTKTGINYFLSPDR